MSIADIVQTVSLLAAAFALWLSLRQTRETARQTSSALAALQQGTREELVRYGADFTYNALSTDHDLLEWFLASRHFPPAGYVENRKSLFLWVRLDQHEGTFHAYRTGAIAEDLWLDWKRSMEIDFAMPEFPRVWTAVREIYSSDFIALVDAATGLRPGGGPRPDVPRTPGQVAGPRRPVEDSEGDGLVAPS
ncbi:hypothetical protein ACQP00_15665 [Dactylosporangium sp. CS-047395]|uniref:hypothetical protein n=1 Tax=Dactylosporangium sp. CS-047395 TaxID=3239936 RepID=UPI003D91C966